MKKLITLAASVLMLQSVFAGELNRHHHNRDDARQERSVELQLLTGASAEEVREKAEDIIPGILNGTFKPARLNAMSSDCNYWYKSSLNTKYDLVRVVGLKITEKYVAQDGVLTPKFEGLLKYMFTECRR